MKLWKRILSAILSIVLVFTLNSIIYFQAINSTVLNPAFFEKELDELNFYPTLKENLISNLGYDFLSSQELTEILEKSVTEKWLREQTNSLITSILNYLNSKTDELVLEVSTAEVKENLKANLPLPPEVTNELLKKLPDSYDLLENLKEPEREEFKNNMALARKYISYFHLGFYLLIAFAVVLILLIILLAKKLKSIFRRIGAAFFISGSSLYFGNFMTMEMVSSQFTPDKLPAFLPQEVLLNIIRDFLEPTNSWGIIFMVIGVIILFWSFLLREEKKEKIEEGKV